MNQILKYFTGTYLKYILIMCILFLVNCNTDKDNFDIIPKKDLISILTDMHIADGAFQMSEMRRNYREYDSLIYYDSIFINYGYNRTDFDSSIAFYISERDELLLIYDEVIENLSRLESQISEEIKEEHMKTKSVNLWNSKDNWKLPEEGEHEKIEFNIPVTGPGKYTVSANIKMHEDDGSRNPRVTAYFYKEDESRHGKRRYFPSSSIDKNNRFKLHILNQELQDTSYKFLRGAILDHSNVNEGDWKKHAEVKNIRITYNKN